MKFPVLLGAFLVAATQTAALSCMRPDVAGTYLRLDDAQETYIVLMGSFSFDPVPQPRGEPRQPVSFPAQFSGQILGSAGFMQTSPTELTVILSCAGPWCGSMPQEGTVTLAFVEVTDAGPVLDVGPCYGSVFAPPTRDDVRRLEACMRGGPCEPAPLSR